MLNYASPQPIDRYGNQVQPEQSSAAPAVATNISGAIVSSMVALDGRATVIEVMSGNGPVAIKWFGSVIGNNPSPSITAANYDNSLPANWVRRFVIPQSVIGVASSGSVVGGYGSANGLYTQLAVIPLQASAPSSIFVSQFA